MYLHALHLPGVLLLPWHIQLFIEGLFNLLVFRFYYLQAIFQYIKHLPVVRTRRKAFKKGTREAGKELLSLEEVTKLVLDNINRVETKQLK